MALRNYSKSKSDNDIIWKPEIFANGVLVTRQSVQVSQQPTCVSLIPFANLVYNELFIENAHIALNLTIEAFRYYVTALLWIRIVDLKRKMSLDTTPEEQILLDMADNTLIAIPEPIFLYLRGLGIITTWIGQRLMPKFPIIPMEVIGSHGGFFGEIDAETHNLYEEFPTMGVTAEAVRFSSSDHPPGPYISVVAPLGFTLNNNLQGFDTLSKRCSDSKKFLTNLDISLEKFPETIPNTGYYHELVIAISNLLKDSKTFKINLIRIFTMGYVGSQAQTVITRPELNFTDYNLRVFNYESRVTSASKETHSTYGVGAVFTYQLFKEPTVQTINLSLRSRTWCCVNFTGEEGECIPDEWVENRNCRRNLPALYMEENYTAGIFYSDTRNQVIKALKLN